MTHASHFGARFWAKVTAGAPTDCWLWKASTRNGYGQIRVCGKTLYAHRVAYEIMIGPIPNGLTIDHVKLRGCKSRLCVNLNHLELVTMKENILRSESVTAVYAKRTHCKRGHELAGDNLAPVQRGCSGRGVCKKCRNMSVQNSREKNIEKIRVKEREASKRYYNSHKKERLEKAKDKRNANRAKP